MRAPTLLLISLSLLLVALAPVASADHVYSHRYLVAGRVVDAADAPVAGVTVSAQLRGIDAEGACANQPGTETDAFGPTRTAPTTNAYGEFFFCFHVHAMSRANPGQAVLRVEGTDAMQEVDLDPLFRASSTILRLNETRGDAAAPDGAYTVAGRVWRAASGPTNVEGIRVFGTTVNRAPVNVTLELDGTTERIATTTNGYGDFSVRVPLAARATEGRVLVEVQGMTHEAAIQPEGITFVKIQEGRSGVVKDEPRTQPAAPTVVTPTDAAPLGNASTDPSTAGTPAPGEIQKNVPTSAIPALVGAAAMALVLLRRR